MLWGIGGVERAPLVTDRLIVDYFFALDNGQDQNKRSHIGPDMFQRGRGEGVMCPSKLPNFVYKYISTEIQIVVREIVNICVNFPDTTLMFKNLNPVFLVPSLIHSEIFKNQLSNNEKINDSKLLLFVCFISFSPRSKTLGGVLLIDRDFTFKYGSKETKVRHGLIIRNEARYVFYYLQLDEKVI